MKGESEDPRKGRRRRRKTRSFFFFLFVFLRSLKFRDVAETQRRDGRFVCLPLVLLVALLEGRRKKFFLQSGGRAEARKWKRLFFTSFTAASRVFFLTLPGALGKIPLSHVGKQTEKKMNALFFFLSLSFDDTHTPLFF